MDDRTAATTATVSAAQQASYRGGDKLRTLYPTIDYLRRRASHHIPRFAFEYSDGGAGTDAGIRRNWAGLDAVELVPRYGVMPALPPVEVELFGRKYAAPLGIPPMGGPAIVWPGADAYMAQAAQRARVPYTLGTVGGITIERAAELAPDVLWFQLYRMARNDHWLGFELMRRCEAAGVHVMVMTVDVPVRTVRPREVVVGLGGSKFSAGPRMLYEMLSSPGWLMSLWQHGQPRFANIKNYAGANASVNEVISFARSEIGGAFTWDEVARYREKWKGPLVLKGIMHPARRRARDRARHRRHLGVEPRRAPDRSAAGADRRAAGGGCTGRVAGHRAVRFGRAQRPRRGAGAGARGACGVCRQGVPLGPRGARRRRP